jgi:hypothetical protein
MGTGPQPVNAPESQVHAEFDRMSQSAPQQTLAEGLTQAFNANQTPPFEQMVAHMFEQSSPEQKAGLLNELVRALGPAGVAQALSGHPAATSLQGGSVTPQQAQQVPAPAVQTLAEQAQRKDPSIVNRAASFYAQHPTLVKSLGAAALALMVSHLNTARR